MFLDFYSELDKHQRIDQLASRSTGSKCFRFERISTILEGVTKCDYRVSVEEEDKYEEIYYGNNLKNACKIFGDIWYSVS